MKMGIKEINELGSLVQELYHTERTVSITEWIYLK